MSGASSAGQPRNSPGRRDLVKLRQLRIEIGLDCPLRCEHCSVFAAPGRTDDMPEREAERLIREFASMGGEEVTLTGGEPLARLGLVMRLLTLARSLGLRTALFTSGLIRHDAGQLRRITTNEAAELATGLDRAVLTLHSADAARHDQIARVAGCHELTVGAVATLVRAEIRTEVHFVPMRDAGHELRALHALSSRLGVAVIRVIRYVRHGRALAAPHLRPTTEDLLDLRRALHDLQDAGDPGIRVGPAFRFLTDQAGYCTAALSELVVGADGRVYPCSGFLGFEGADSEVGYRDRSLREVWETSRVLEATRRLTFARIAHGVPPTVGCLAQKALACGEVSDDLPDLDAHLLLTAEERARAARHPGDAVDATRAATGSRVGQPAQTSQRGHRC